MASWLGGELGIGGRRDSWVRVSEGCGGFDVGGGCVQVSAIPPHLGGGSE